MQKFKLGLKPQRYNPKRLFLSKYINRSIIHVPNTVPLNLGTWQGVIHGMLANGPDPLNPPQISSGVGDCFWAACLRKVVMDRLSRGQHLDLNQSWAVKSVLEGYASTGFDINNPNATDQGTDPDQGFSYMRKVGLRVSSGTYDRFAAFATVNWHDPSEIQIAHNLFGGLMVGVRFPAAWENAPVWDVTNSQIEGGHEIFAYSDVGVTPAGLVIDTWGEKRILTFPGMAQNCDQLTAVIAWDFFGSNGKAINGFDVQQLAHDAGVTIP